MKKLVLAILLGTGLSVSAQESAISLTLHECIERALANNLDISIERVNPQIQSANVLAAYGPFDPHLQFQYNRQDVPTFLVATNTTTVETRSELIFPSLTGLLPTGTRYDLSFNSTLQESSPSFSPQDRAIGTVSLVQPLLRNWGFGSNLAGLRIARKQRNISVYALVARVTDTINQLHKAYFDLIFAIENLKVQQESLDLAKALLAENKKRLEVGLMSPLDVTQAESGVASQEELKIEAEQAIKTQENLLRRLISADVGSLRKSRIIPVDAPSVEPVSVQVEESIRLGLQNRPEYLQQKQQIEANDIQLRYNRNQLFPQLDLQATYGRLGLRSTFNDAFDSMASSGSAPQWLIGLVVDIPLGDLAARGNYRASQLQVKQSILALKSTEQDIIVDVDNAAAQVLTNLKRIEATRSARRLAEATLLAERKKLEDGTSTSYNVLLHQRDLTNARSQEIRAIADYNESLSDLHRAEGTLLQKNNITVQAD